MDSCDLAAVDILSRYRAKTLSPVEVMRDLEHRLSLAEPLLAATWAVDLDAALRAASASEARWLRGEPVGVLDGVPVSIKEMIATRGTPKPIGSAAGDMTPMAEDAPPVARLRAAGAIVWGKTTNPDFGMLSSGLSSFHALSRNPWDLTRTPGGSSSGAAAAAAAGYGPLHIGTDIGGSLRLPAGWCGIFTLKPSFGRIPIDPPFIGRVAGPMTRTVADTALAMSQLALPDARDYMSLPPAQIDWLERDVDCRGLRIALLLDAGCGTAPSDQVVAAVSDAARLFADAGATIVPVEPFLTQDMLDGLDRFWRTRLYAETRRLPAERYDRILPYIRQWFEPARDYDGLTVYEGFGQIQRMQELGNAQFAPFDFLISPVSPETAFSAQLPSPTNDPDQPFEHIGFTVAYNMTGQPAAAINCGYDGEGLPIGLQIVGRRFDDRGVLALAQAFERMRPLQKPWPRPWEARRS